MANEPLYDPKSGGFVTRQTITSASDLAMAQAAASIQKTMQDIADTMLKSGSSMEKVIQVVNEQTRAQRASIQMGDLNAQKIKEVSRLYNMSAQDIAKMPLPDLIKNFDRITFSIRGMLAPLASVSTAFVAVKMAVDAMANSARGMAALQSGYGGISVFGFSPSGQQRGQLLGVQQRLNLMGFTDLQQQEQIMAMTSQNLPRGVSRMAGGDMALAVAARARTMQLDPQMVSQIYGTGMMSGESPKNLEVTFARLDAHIKAIPLQQTAKMFSDLWMIGRQYGRTQKDIVDEIQKSQFALAAGRVTSQGQQQLVQGSVSAQFAELARFIQVLKNVGMAGQVRGLDVNAPMFDQTSALRRFIRESPTDFGNLYERALPEVAKSMYGSSSEEAILLAARGALALSAAPEERIRNAALKLSTPQVPWRAVEDTDLEKSPAMRSFVKQIQAVTLAPGVRAVEMFDEVKGVSGTFGQAKTAVELFTGAIVNATKEMIRGKPTALNTLAPQPMVYVTKEPIPMLPTSMEK